MSSTPTGFAEGSGVEDLSWVSPSIRATRARLVKDKSLAHYQEFIEAPEGQSWRLKDAEDFPICASFGKEMLGFFFHGKTMDLMGIRIPLTKFQQAVLNYLHLAPSQLVPNGWGFIRTFELLMEYLKRVPSVRVFFAFTRLTRLPEKGEKGFHAHVGFRGVTDEAIFTPVTDSNKGYKKQYFYVQAANRAARETIASSYVSREEYVPNFPFNWTAAHFVSEVGSYNVEPGMLSGEDAISYNLLYIWSDHLRSSGKKFPCKDIIEAALESADKLKSVLDGLAQGVDLTRLPPPSVLRPCKVETKGKKMRREGATGRDIAGSSTPSGSWKMPAFVLPEDIEVPSEADLAVCGRAAEVGKSLWDAVKRAAVDAQVGWYRAKLRKLDKQALWDEGDLLDQGDKLACVRDVLLPEIKDFNQVFYDVSDYINSVGPDLEKLEVQAVGYQQEADEYDAMVAELEGVNAEIEECRQKSLAAEARISEKEAEGNGMLERSMDFIQTGFDRCKAQVEVLRPELPADLLKLGHVVYGGKIVKPSEGASLDEAEVVFSPLQGSEDTNMESSSEEVSSGDLSSDGDE